MTLGCRFNARAARRLCIAAALMRVGIGTDPTDAQCEQLLRRIQALDARQRERLRGWVDWVEAYELMEEAAAANGCAQRPLIHRNCGQGGGETADEVRR